MSDQYAEDQDSSNNQQRSSSSRDQHYVQHGSSSIPRLSDGHLDLDETSPAAQPGKDRSSRLPSHSNCTVHSHHPAGINDNTPINNNDHQRGLDPAALTLREVMPPPLQLMLE